MDKLLIKRKASTPLGSPGTSSTGKDVPSAGGIGGKKQKTSTKCEGSKAAYEEKRTRGFVTSWRKEFPWLENDEKERVMYCKWCRAYPSLADRASPLFIGTGPGAKKKTDYRKGGLNTHNNSSHHKKVEGKRYADENPGQAPMDIHLNNVSQEEKNRLCMLINTAHSTAKEDVAMKKFPKLCDLQEKNGLKLGENYRNDKSCREFVDAIAETSRDDICNDVKSAKFLCVLADGTTDRAVIEQEAVYVRYVDNDGEIQTKMADCVALKSGDAKGVLEGINKGLQSVGVDEQVLKEKLVACNFDGAAVNMGKDNGVAKQIQDNIGEHVITVHCLAHNLELAVLDVLKDNAPETKYMESLESTLRGVYKFYHQSPKKRRG